MPPKSGQRVKRRAVKLQQDSAQKRRRVGDEGGNVGSISALLKEAASTSTTTTPPELLPCSGEEGLYAEYKGTRPAPLINVDAVIKACESSVGEEDPGAGLETSTIHGSSLHRNIVQRALTPPPSSSSSPPLLLPTPKRSRDGRRII